MLRLDWMVIVRGYVPGALTASPAAVGLRQLLPLAEVLPSTAGFPARSDPSRVDSRGPRRGPAASASLRAGHAVCSSALRSAPMGQARGQTESGELTKAERRQAKRERKGRIGPDPAAGGAPPERLRAEAGELTKAERRQAKRERKGRVRSSARVWESGEDASLQERIESRLSRIEGAMATQSERTDELLEKVDEVLYEKPESAAEKPAEG